MRTAAFYELTWPTVTKEHDGAAPQTLSTPPKAEQKRWRSQFFVAPQPHRFEKRRATRYERFTTRMVLVSSLITFGVTASLHVLNYGLETTTSSTSGTHGSFYKEDD